MDGRTHCIGDVVWYLGTAQLVDPYGVANARRPSDRSDRSVENRHTDVPGFGAAFELLETAVAAGVVGFDTARKYGGAEAVLGEFARAHELTLPVVTKILDTPTDALTDQQFVEDALKSIADAQRRLAPLTVEAVLFHDPETALRRRNAVRTLVARAQT